MESKPSTYSIREEIANTITHGIGIILAIIALGVLAAFAYIYGNTWHIIYSV